MGSRPVIATTPLRTSCCVLNTSFLQKGFSLGLASLRQARTAPLLLSSLLSAHNLATSSLQARAAVTKAAGQRPSLRLPAVACAAHLPSGTSLLIIVARSILNADRWRTHLGITLRPASASPGQAQPIAEARRMQLGTHPQHCPPSRP